MHFESRAILGPRCLVTGGTGFIGTALIERLRSDGIDVRGSVRKGSTQQSDRIVVGELGPETDWAPALKDRDVVIHTAGRAHVLNERHADPLSLFRLANVDGTLRLAHQALEAGVRRFVYVSSVGVNGAISGSEPFTEDHAPAPHAAYAQSKLEAEQGLVSLFSGTAAELVLVRPPLVYAAHAPGNFARLLRLVERGLPMPFGNVDNRRSLVSLNNLTDFLRCCAVHPAAANQLFLIADERPVSIGELLTLLATGMGRPLRLVSVPPALLHFAARLAGRQGLFEQLCGSLEIDISKARQVIGWRPPEG